MPDTYTPVLTDAQILAVGAFGQSPLKRLDHGRAIERAAIEAYQRQQWQHISTAPKDGTEILLSDDDDGIQARMRWDASMHNGLCGDVQGFWTCPGQNFTWDHRSGFGPTKWKRLPDLPTSSVHNPMENPMTDRREREAARVDGERIKE